MPKLPAVRRSRGFVRLTPYEPEEHESARPELPVRIKPTSKLSSSFTLLKNMGNIPTTLVKKACELFVKQTTTVAINREGQGDVEMAPLAEINNKKKEQNYISVKGIKWTLEDLETMEKALRRGSASYSVDVAHLVVRMVVLQLLEEQRAFEEQVNDTIANDIEIGDDNDVNDHDDGDEKDVLRKPTLNYVCLDVARVCHIQKTTVKKCVHAYFTNGEFPQPELRRSDVFNIETHKGLPIPYILETIEFIDKRRLAGQRTNLGIIQDHIKGPSRLHPHVTLVTAPSANISQRVIRRALEKAGCFAFSKMQAVGKQKGVTPELVDRNLWRMRVHIAVQARFAIEEEEGKVLLLSSDETFIHKNHNGKFGLTTIDEDFDAETDLYCGAGKGPRMCIVSGITQYGAMVPESETGVLNRDCMFIDGKGKETDASGGHFVEIDPEGKVRPAFLRKKKVTDGKEKSISSLNLAELQERALSKSVVVGTPGSPRRLLKKDYIDALLAHEATQRTADAVVGPVTVEHILETQEGKEGSAKQLVLRDYKAYEQELSDMAHTTTKFMIANQSLGDYHDNFDSASYFKWKVAVMLTYADYCKFLQRKLDAGTLLLEKGEPAPNDKPFYDWFNDRPVRSLVLLVDGAPYHCGMTIQLKSKSMEQIAELLRLKGVASIEVLTHIDVNGGKHYMNYEVPGKGKKWGKKGLPSAAQVLKGARRAFKHADPTLLEEPWRRLLREKKDAWGPANRPGWIVSQNMPYAASKDWVPVEFSWADVKNHIGAPSKENEEDRTFAKIAKQFNARLRDGANCAALFRHCNSKMEKDINRDHDENGGPLSGEFPHFDGLPDDKTLASWAKKAGYPKGSDFYMGSCFEPTNADAMDEDDGNSDSDGTVVDGDDDSDVSDAED